MLLILFTTHVLDLANRDKMRVDFDTFQHAIQVVDFHNMKEGWREYNLSKIRVLALYDWLLRVFWHYNRRRYGPVGLGRVLAVLREFSVSLSTTFKASLPELLQRYSGIGL